MKNSLDLTPEQLEHETWGEPGYLSSLVITIHRLRKKKLSDFTVEDLRIMIGQQFSLDYMLPLAIAQLRLNILAEGKHYEGDLLSAVLTIKKEFWQAHQEDWLTLKGLIKNNRQRLRSDREIQKSIERFEAIFNE